MHNLTFQVKRKLKEALSLLEDQITQKQKVKKKKKKKMKIENTSHVKSNKWKKI